MAPAIDFSAVINENLELLARCGSLNVTDSHNLTVNGTFRSCGLVEVGVALLEKVCHYGDSL